MHFYFDPPANLSDDFIVKLSDELGLNDEERVTFKKGVLWAGSRWLSNRAESHSSEARREMRKALGQLSNSAQKTLDQLRSAPEGVWEVMSDTFRHVGASEFERHIEVAQDFPDTSPEDGEPQIVLPVPGISETRISIGDLKLALETLALGADFATKWALEGKHGPAPDIPLEGWVRDMASLWANELHKPFTRDATPDNEPISQAAKMCIAIYEKIAPETPRSRVLNEMKKVVATRNEYAHWKKSREI